MVEQRVSIPDSLLDKIETYLSDLDGEIAKEICEELENDGVVRHPVTRFFKSHEGEPPLELSFKEFFDGLHSEFMGDCQYIERMISAMLKGQRLVGSIHMYWIEDPKIVRGREWGNLFLLSEEDRCLLSNAMSCYKQDVYEWHNDYPVEESKRVDRLAKRLNLEEVGYKCG